MAIYDVVNNNLSPFGSTSPNQMNSSVSMPSFGNMNPFGSSNSGVSYSGSITPKFTNPTSNNNGSFWFDGAGNFNWGNLFTGANAIAGLAGIFNSFRQNQLAEEMIDYQKELANRNLANMTKQINNMYDSNAKIAAAFRGGTGGLTEDQVREQYLANAQKKHLDGSAIA